MSINYSAFNLILTALVLITTAYICWQSVARSGIRMRVVLLEILRFVLVALAAFTLFQPTYVSRTPSERNSVVRVFVDQSGSMETADVATDEGTQSRAETVSALIHEKTWSESAKKHSVQIDPIASGALASPSNSDENPSTSSG